MSMKIRRLVSKLRVLMMMRCYYRLLIGRFGFRVVNRCGRCMVFWFWMVSWCRRHRCVVFRLRMVFWFRVVCRCYRCMIFRLWMVSRCHHRCMIFGLRMVSRCHRCMVFRLWMISWSGRCMILWLRWSMVFRLRMIIRCNRCFICANTKEFFKGTPTMFGWRVSFES